MPIPTNILQSMMSINAAEIDKLSIMLISYKDLRTYHSKQGARVGAEKWNKLVVKTKEKIAKLARNQKFLRQEINENTFNDYVNWLTYVCEE